MKKKIYFLALLFPLLSGCDDFFAPNTDDTLLEKDYIGTSYELYTGYMGLAACVQDVVDHPPGGRIDRIADFLGAGGPAGTYY